MTNVEREIILQDIRNRITRAKSPSMAIERYRFLLSELDRRDEALKDLLDAMSRYEMDVDDFPTSKHITMMKRAREALGEA